MRSENRERLFENLAQQEGISSSEFYQVYKKVKRIKGFYVHLFVFILVNAFIIVTKYNKNINDTSNFWQWQTLNTVFFWGIGLVSHGLSVFGRNIFFGTNWEERKIQELMEKDKSEKWE